MRHPKVLISIVADDLTGAADTCVSFAVNGHKAFVFFPWTPLPTAFERYPAAAYAIDTASRTLDGASAAAGTTAALRASLTLSPRIVYLKLDSNLRGPIIPLLERLRSACPRRAIPVVPAFPETGRTTLDGTQRIDGVPAHEHEMGKDALTPVRHAHLPTLLAKIGQTASISLETLRAGGLTQALRRVNVEGAQFVVIDCERRHDLDEIARALLADERPIACAGSGGLAGSLARILADHTATDPDLRPFGRTAPQGIRPGVHELTAPALVLTLSLKDRARRQLEAYGEVFPTAVRLELSATAVRNRPSDHAKQLAASAAASLAQGRDVIVCPAAGEPVLPDFSPALLEAAGDIARSVLSEVRCERIIAVGGDTAAAVLGRLEAEGLELLGEVESGMPTARIAGGVCGGGRIVTKSGGFGDAQSLVRARRFIGKGWVK